MKTFEFSKEGLDKAVEHKNNNTKYLLLAFNLGLLGLALYNPTTVAFVPNNIIDTVVAFKMGGM